MKAKICNNFVHNSMTIMNILNRSHRRIIFLNTHSIDRQSFYSQSSAITNNNNLNNIHRPKRCWRLKLGKENSFQQRKIMPQTSWIHWTRHERDVFFSVSAFDLYFSLSLRADLTWSFCFQYSFCIDWNEETDFNRAYFLHDSGLFFVFYKVIDRFLCVPATIMSSTVRFSMTCRMGSCWNNNEFLMIDIWIIFLK